MCKRDLEIGGRNGDLIEMALCRYACDGSSGSNRDDMVIDIFGYLDGYGCIVFLLYRVFLFESLHGNTHMQ